MRTDDAEEPPRAHARTTDPHTSHAAADSLDPTTLTEIQTRVYCVLVAYGPMPDQALIFRYRCAYGHAGESTIRTRRHELVERGLVVDTGERVVQGNGRLAIVWRAVP